MFNHQARWDRALPNDISVIPGTPVPAVCRIDKGKIFPQSFVWGGRAVAVTKVHYSWKDKKGREVLDFYSVGTPLGNFEIVFSRENLSWHLVRLIGP